MPGWKKVTYLLSLVAAIKIYSAYQGHTELYSKGFMNLGNDSWSEEAYKSDRIVASSPPKIATVSKSLPFRSLPISMYNMRNLAGTWKIIKHEEWAIDDFENRLQDDYRNEQFYTYIIPLRGLPSVILRNVSQNPHARVKPEEVKWSITFFENSNVGKGIALMSTYTGEDGRVYVERLQLTSVILRLVQDKKIAQNNNKPAVVDQPEEKRLFFEKPAKLIKGPFSNKYFGPDNISGNIEVKDSILTIDVSTSGVDIPGYDIRTISVINAKLKVTTDSMSTAVVENDGLTYSLTVFKKGLSNPDQHEIVVHFIGGPYNNIRLHFSDYSYEKELRKQEEMFKNLPQQVQQRPQVQPQAVQYQEFKQRAEQIQGQQQYQEEEYDEEDDFIEEDEAVENRANNAQVTQAQANKYLKRTGYSF